MTLEQSCLTLTEGLRDVQSVLEALSIAIVEDRPQTSAVVLVDLLDDAVADMLGWLEESLSAASNAHHALVHQNSLRQMTRALGACQARFNRLELRYFDLLSHNRLTPLVQFGLQRGGEWQAWTTSMRDALEDGQQSIVAVKQALLDCWQGIAEQVGRNNIERNNHDNSKRVAR